VSKLLQFAFALAVVVLPVSAQSTRTTTDSAAVPREVTYCELAKDPAAYDKAEVRLTAFVTHGFEDFTITQPDCATPPAKFSLWVEYGGKTESNTVYCCPGEAGGATRQEPLTVDGIQVPLTSDGVFQQFTDLLKKEPDTTVRVTAVGRFFAGRKQNYGGGPPFWGGYGHLGCCSLFVIERVEQFAPHTRGDLDYTSEAGWYENEGCKDKSLKYLNHVSLSFSDGTEEVIADQKLADDGTRAWAFSDPERVATDSLRPFFKGQTPVLRNVKKTPARQVFRWRNGKTSVVVVVIRPYWLSFYAKSDSIAWVSTTIKEADCE